MLGIAGFLMTITAPFYLCYTCLFRTKLESEWWGFNNSSGAVFKQAIINSIWTVQFLTWASPRCSSWQVFLFLDLMLVITSLSLISAFLSAQLARKLSSPCKANLTFTSSSVFITITHFFKSLCYVIILYSFEHEALSSCDRDQYRCSSVISL